MASNEQTAVVCAYHNVGVRGLAVLLSLGVKVPLVLTHRDDPAEDIWFDSVRELAELNRIPVITPGDPNQPDVLHRVRACRPHWLFSFYYRYMLGKDFLSLAPSGAYNLHGSLLPNYRGRVPVNWAVLHGGTETGASLHRMVEKPDAGPLVDQQAVPILPNDTAHTVFQKVTCAAEMLLVRSLPKLLNGSAEETPLDLAAGSYFGGRRPEDGAIDWRQTAWQIHNLIRAVAPPYPGAFFFHQGERIDVLGSYFRGENAERDRPCVYWSEGRCYADCSDGQRIQLLQMSIEDAVLDERACRDRFGDEILYV
jgi:methionyl-tRNA formyltransferase